MQEKVDEAAEEGVRVTVDHFFILGVGVGLIIPTPPAFSVSILSTLPRLFSTCIWLGEEEGTFASRGESGEEVGEWRKGDEDRGEGRAGVYVW